MARRVAQPAQHVAERALGHLIGACGQCTELSEFGVAGHSSMLMMAAGALQMQAQQINILSSVTVVLVNPCRTRTRRRILGLQVAKLVVEALVQGALALLKRLAEAVPCTTNSMVGLQAVDLAHGDEQSMAWVPPGRTVDGSCTQLNWTHTELQSSRASTAKSFVFRT